jgi:CheY-like chemotaxis protein/PAS domain-containing protein
MKRIYLLLATVIVIILAANIYYYLNIYNQQINFQKSILCSQTEICSNEIEKHISDLEKDLDYFLITEDISRFFIDSEMQSRSIGKMEVLLSKYKNLVSGISIYDNTKNVFVLVKDQDENMISNQFVSREQTVLEVDETTLDLHGAPSLTIPVILSDEAVANVVVKIDIQKYTESVFANYHIANTLWQWLITEDRNIVYGNFMADDSFTEIITDVVLDQPAMAGSLIHKLDAGNGPKKVISTYYPVKLLQNDAIIIFSLDASTIISYIANSIMIIAATTFLVLIIIIFFFLYFIRIERKERLSLKESEQALKNILESLPLGIIIKSAENRIQMINAAALDILKISSASSVLGKDISNMFFISGATRNSVPVQGDNNASKVVWYDTDDNEVVIYKKEIPSCFLGNKVMVEAFMDISAIDLAQKKEFRFRKAMTEFLKKVNHDIRNPLNGIINMADLMNCNTSEGSGDNDKISLIKQSCEEIMSVVNDITDFSGPFTPEDVSEKTDNQDISLNNENPVLNTGSLNILVAEDNDINKIVASSMFKSLGYVIDIASDGKEVLQKIKSKDYDIIFMDINMPLKNGIDTTYDIRKLGYTMPIIAMTAKAHDSDRAEALSVGMDDFISKPVNKEIVGNILLKRFSSQPD